MKNNLAVSALLAFAIGIVLGAGGIWFAGKGPSLRQPSSIPDVKGISGSTFMSLENQTVTGVNVNVVLDGYITGVRDKIVLLINGQNNQIQTGVVTNDQTTIIEPPKDNNQPRQLQLSDLKIGDHVVVFAVIQGSAIVAESISKVENQQ